VATLRELFEYQTVDPNNLTSATAAAIYASFIDSPPPLKVTLRHPDLPWDLIWPRLWRPRMVAKEQDLTLRLLNNLLPVRARLARFGLIAQTNCPHCPGVLETALHVFTVCNRVANRWHQLVATLLPHTGPQQDEDLLYLAWPVVARHFDITVALMVYVDQVWASRDGRRPTKRLLPAPFLPLW
jgi:zinc-binding in reverse transcriptase